MRTPRGRRFGADAWTVGESQKKRPIPRVRLRRCLGLVPWGRRHGWMTSQPNTRSLQAGFSVAGDVGPKYAGQIALRGVDAYPSEVLDAVPTRLWRISVRQPSLSRQCVARGLMYLRPSCPEPGLK